MPGTLRATATIPSARMPKLLEELEAENARLRSALKEAVEAMAQFEARALTHHRYREPLSVALDLRIMIDKILDALSHAQIA